MSPSGQGTVSGQVTFGSQGPFPEDLAATLGAFDNTQQVLTRTAPLNPDGSFAFPDIPVVDGRIFFVEVDYKGQRYFSDFVTADPGQTRLDLPLTIFDTTSDTSQLAVESNQQVFDFSTPGYVRVVKRVSITNLGDKAVAPDGDQPVLHYQVPQGASDLGFEQGALGDRYVSESSGFGDLRAVLPGQETYDLLFTYNLPYSSGLNYQISIDLPTRSLVALLPEGDLHMTTDVLQLVGSQQVDQTNYSVYSSDAGFTPGETVTLQISGPHPLGGVGLGSLLQDNDLLVGLAALTVAIGLVWWWLRAATVETKESVMDEIVTLDQRYEAGQVGEKAYRKRRTALKARLAKLVARGKSS